MDKKHEELYQKALRLWGRELQLVMVAEEMAELTQAVTKEIRCNQYAQGIIPYNLIEETADCLIMLEQLIFIFNMQQEVDDVIEMKLKRLKKTISEQAVK